MHQSILPFILFVDESGVVLFVSADYVSPSAWFCPPLCARSLVSFLPTAFTPHVCVEKKCSVVSEVGTVAGGGVMGTDHAAHFGGVLAGEMIPCAV